MDGTAKVVNLEQKRKADAALSSRALQGADGAVDNEVSRGENSLPAVLDVIRKTGRHLLHTKLKSFFDQVDDALYERADSAGANSEQNLYFDAMREIRVQQKGLERQFFARIDEAFANLVTCTNASVIDDIATGSDNLSLVQNDDLEVLVAKESLISRAKRENVKALHVLTMSFEASISAGIKLSDNPFGPALLCEAFVSLTEGIDVDIKAKLVFLKLFDRVVLGELPSFYKALNQIFDERGLQAKPMPVEQKAYQYRNHLCEERSADSRLEDKSFSRADQNIEIPMAQLASYIENSGKVQRENTETLSTQLLVQALSAMQHEAQFTSVTPDRQKALDSPSLLSVVKERSGAAASVSRMDEEVINLVNMLFNFILEDGNLPGPIKELISCLHIPIIKVALSDNTFFTKNGHPCRRLLNELAMAGLAWSCENEDPTTDLLYSKIEEVVANVVVGFDADVQVFSDQLASFMRYLGEEKRKAAVLEKRILDAEDGKAKSENVKTAIDKEIDGKLHGVNLPVEIQSFINTGWRQVLVVLGLKHGLDSKEYLGAVKVLHCLIWSVKPCGSKETRRKLINLIPKLNQNLRMGLEVISFNPYEVTKVFKVLDRIHLARIRGHDIAECDGQAKVESEIKTQPVESTTKPENIVPVQVPDGVSNNIQVAEPFDQYSEQVKSLNVGAWFELREPGRPHLRCRLAALIQGTGKYIFVNRNGKKAAEKTAGELAQHLRQDELRPLDHGRLFDRALERVVTGLRETQQSSMLRKD